MNIGAVTTSRADFGIYYPLLKKIEETEGMELKLFVGGMHLSSRYGKTADSIKEQGFEITALVDSMIDGDGKGDIARSMAKTIEKFTDVWEEQYEDLDLVFFLGDRYEMFAACASLSPFNVKIAHIHGGEITEGALDDKYRNAISAMSDFHFTSHEEHKKRVINILGKDEHVYNVGALGIDSILSTDLLSRRDFDKKYSIDSNREFVLFTFHPETIGLHNKEKIHEILEAIDKMETLILCTLPNADLEGNVIREALLKYEKQHSERFRCHENLGRVGYYSAMNHCKFLLGNTSSGIIEAATFNKAVINIGDRQKGRLHGKNVLHVKCKSTDIKKACNAAEEMKALNMTNPYGEGHSAEKIIEILKDNF